MFLAFCLLLGNLLGDWFPVTQSPQPATPRQQFEARTVYNEGLKSAQQKDYATALRLFEKAVALDPAFPEAHFLLGVILYDQGKWKSASDSMTTAIRLRPDWLPPYLNKIEIDLARGKSKEAEPIALRAVQVNPKSPEAHYWLGVVHDRLDRDEEALKSLELALQLRPQYAEALTKIGQLHDFKKREQEAIAAYQQAIAANPKLGEPHDYLGRLYIRQKQFALARAEVNALTDLQDPNAKLVEQTLLKAERLDKAERALATRPNDPLILTEMGMALLDQDPWRMDDRAYRARELFTKSLRFKPNYAQAHFGLGLCAVELKEFPIAEREQAILQKLNKSLASQLKDKIADGSIHGRMPSIRATEK